MLGAGEGLPHAQRHRLAQPKGAEDSKGGGEDEEQVQDSDIPSQSGAASRIGGLVGPFRIVMASSVLCDLLFVRVSRF